jgi:hypothetical protein
MSRADFGVAWHRQQRSGRTGHGTTAGRHDPSGLGFRVMRMPDEQRTNDDPGRQFHKCRGRLGPADRHFSPIQGNREEWVSFIHALQTAHQSRETGRNG